MAKKLSKKQKPTQKLSKIVGVQGNRTENGFEITGQLIGNGRTPQDLRIIDHGNGTKFDMTVGKNTALGFPYFSEINNPAIVKALSGVESLEVNASCDAKTRLLVGCFVKGAKELKTTKR